MTATQITLIVVGIVLLGLIVLCYILGKDYFTYSDLITPVLDALLKVLKAVGGIFPDSSVIKAIGIVISSSIQAAGYAEELWIKGEINKELRPQYAQEYVLKLLDEAEIKVTDSITSIIEGAIALACYFMPHHKEEEETA